MSVTEVQHYLHEHIPLSADMGVAVVRCEAEAVVLRAPLAPNLNHRATVFGGSASAVSILAAWTWLNFRLIDAGVTTRLVIQRNTMEYLAPIAGDFEAECRGVPAEAFEKFLRTLRRAGRARLTLAATLRFCGAEAGAFTGDYVALTTR